MELMDGVVFNPVRRGNGVKNDAIKGNVDRPYPSCIEYERALLGAIMMQQSILSEIREIIEPEHFYRRDHELLYQMMLEMEDSNEVIDTITIPERVSRRGDSDRYGGLAYVVALPDHAVSVSNAEFYANKIVEVANLRKMIEISQNFMNRLFACELNSAEAVVFMKDKLEDMESSSRKRVEERRYFFQEEMCDMGDRAERGEQIVGIPSGFEKIDYMTKGWQGSQFIVVGARPSIGKTTLAINLIHNALEAGHGVAFYSTEETGKQIARRFISRKAHVNIGDLATGQISADEWDRVSEAQQYYEVEKPFHLIEAGAMDVRAIRNHAIGLSKKHGIKMIVVDYLQRVKPDRRIANRHEQVADISKTLADLSKELDIPVIALAQLTRENEKRKEKRPILPDLRESGDIEQDADIIMFIHREDRSSDKAELIISKCRHGQTGDSTVQFRGGYCLMQDFGYNDSGL